MVNGLIVPTIPPPLYPDMTLASLSLAAFALLAASYTDLRWRRIPNSLCLFVAWLALPYWVGRAGWRPEALLVPLTLLLASATILIPLWLARLIGGGDVKLLASLMLWQDGHRLDVLLVGTVLAGGAIGLVLWAAERLRPDGARLSVPYGVAITAGAFLAFFPLYRALLLSIR